MQISKNYKLSEFAQSAKARQMGRAVEIPADVIPHIHALVFNLLQPISDATGWANVISSGYRPDWLNKAVGGSDTSQHPKGQAADCNFYERKADGKLGRKIPTVEVMAKVRELGLPFDQMIAYNTFTHLSYSARRRMQVLYNKGYTGKRLPNG